MSYRVVARDGAEYAPVSFDTLLDWYEGGRVDADSLVYSEETARWTKLRDVLELPEPEELVSDRVERTGAAIAEPRPLLAGYTLLANGGLAFAGTVALAGEGLLEHGVAWGYGLAALDVLIGLGLVLLGSAITPLALARAALVGGFLGIAAPLLWGGGALAFGLAAFHLLFAASLAALLLARRPVGLFLAGAAAAWVGIGALQVFGRVLPERAARGELRAAALAQREVRDEEAGITLRLPAGWVLLNPSSGALGAPQGKALAAHAATGGAALLQVLPGAPKGTPRDAAEAAALRLAGGGGYTPAAGEASQVANLPAWRAEGTFLRNGRRYRSSATVAPRTEDQVTLLFWCPEERAPAGAAALRELVSDLQVAAEGGSRRRELEREATLRLPYLGVDGRAAVVAEAMRLRLPPAELEAFATQRIVAGIQRADGHELGALEELMDVLATRVDKADVPRLQAQQALFARGGRLDEKGARELLQMIAGSYRDAGELRGEEADAFARALTGALLIGLRAG